MENSSCRELGQVSAQLFNFFFPPIISFFLKKGVFFSSAVSACWINPGSFIILKKPSLAPCRIHFCVRCASSARRRFSPNVNSSISACPIVCRFGSKVCANSQGLIIKSRGNVDCHHHQASWASWWAWQSSLVFSYLPLEIVEWQLISRCWAANIHRTSPPPPPDEKQKQSGWLLEIFRLHPQTESLCVRICIYKNTSTIYSNGKKVPSSVCMSLERLIYAPSCGRGARAHTHLKNNR